MKILTSVLILVILLGLQICSASEFDVFSFPQNSNYGYRTKDMNVRPFEFELFKKNGTKSTDFEPIFSGKSHDPLNLCDTNAVVYTSIDKDHSYLIVTKLSPNICTDTLFIFSNSNGKLAQDTRRFWFSLRDSLLAITEIEENRKVVNIYKNESTHKYKRLVQISEGYEISMSGDFTQFFIDRQVDDQNFRMLGRSEFAVYDITLEKLSFFSSKEYNYSKPERNHRDSSLYFLKNSGKERNLWKISVDGVEELVFSVEWPEYVFDFSLWKEHIWANIGHYETGVQYGRSVFIPISD